MIAILLAASIYVVYTYSDEQKDSITIAALLPLTGRGSHLIDMKYALEEAVDIVNSWGGINGSNIDLIIRDSQSNASVAIQEFADLEASEKPLLYLSAMCGISLALSSKAEEAGAVLMGVGVLLQNLTEDKEWAFRYSPTTGDDVATILAIVERLGVERVGVLYSNDMCTRAAMSMFVESFEILNGTTVTQQFDERAETYYDEIAALSDTDAIVIFGPTERYGVLLSELEEVGYAGEIIGGLSASDPSITSLPSADGMYLSAPYIYNTGYVYADEFSAQFEETYGVPLSHRGAAIFDAVIMLRGLLEDREVSRENLKAVLEAEFLYSGLTGIIHNVDLDHDLGYPLFAVRIVDGEMVYQW